MRDTITAVLPLPQDESLWEALHLVFATARGSVRRNRLSDFRNVRAAGLIAMKLDGGDEAGSGEDRLIGVATIREGDDVLLNTRSGRCIRFQAVDETLRVFAGRDSSGVRGIRVNNGRSGDEVIALSVLKHVDATPAERDAYLRIAAGRRRSENAQIETEAAADTLEAEEGVVEPAILSPERVTELEEAEQFILTVTDGGFGKRSSAYEYRASGRGGQGIAAITLTGRTGTAVAGAFVLQSGDDVMLVTDSGRLVRTPGDRVRITGRTGMGVTLVRLGSDERVTSVFPVIETAAPDSEESETDEAAPEGPADA